MTPQATSTTSEVVPDHDAVTAERFRRVRDASTALASPLSAEDACVQSMPDASPTKWHLGHTTWFFETFVLRPGDASYRVFDPSFDYLFNSYYNTVGEQHPRPRRGLLTRPSLDRVLEYRRHVDAAMLARVREGDVDERARWVVDIGLHHEQQHQELLLMDVQHLLSCNPTDPAYVAAAGEPATGDPAPLRFLPVDGGVYTIGHAGGRFAYDNEGPRHDVVVAPFELASRPVTNGEYLAFVRDGGYRRHELWLADGWAHIAEHGWHAPLYWTDRDGCWTAFTLHGRQALREHDPVCHLSYYEADAYARWAGARLPTEAEWEIAAGAADERDGHFVDDGTFRPVAAADPDGAGWTQMFGDVWEWTSSAYAPYPGYRAPAGAIGEYNGKFMVSQYVLRGGCCATPRSHIRRTYRNFFYPWMRWQFSGIRLARDA